MAPVEKEASSTISLSFRRRSQPRHEHFPERFCCGPGLGQTLAPEGPFMASQGEQEPGQGRPEAEPSLDSKGSPSGSVLLVYAVCQGPASGVWG